MVTRLVEGGQVLSPLGEMSTPDYVSYLSTERAQRFFNAIAPAEEGDIPEEAKESHNVMVAPFGESAPFSLSRPYSRVIALRTEIECAKPVNITAPAMIDGVTFTSSVELNSEMVVLNHSGTTVFRSCTFVLTADSVLRSCVKLASPTQAVFLGCYFVRESGSGGNAIFNQPAPGLNVKVVGCVATGYTSFGVVAPANIIGSFV